MPTLGLFGGAAPRLTQRIRETPPAAPAFTPDDEAMFQTWYRARTAKAGLDPNPDAPEHKYDYRRAYIAGAAPDQTGHWPSEFKAPDHPNRFVDGIDTITGDPAPASVPPMGLMMRGPAKPKPQGAGIAEMFGYKGDASGMGALEWWFSPAARREAAAKGVAAQQGLEQQRAEMNRQIQALQQQGYAPDQIIAFMNNPEKWSESLATNLEAANVAGGDSRYVNGKMITADKYGMDGGFGYRQGPGGLEVQGQRPMSYDETLKADEARQPQFFNTGQAVVSVSPQGAPKVLYRDPVQPTGSQMRMRPASPQEASQYGPPGTMGQIDEITGRFYPTSRPNVQTGALPTEGERKFGLYAATAKRALEDLDKLEFGGQYGPNAKSTYDRTMELNPFSETAKKYDQGLDRFLDGWARAMTGAAMTTDEKNYYYGILKPAFGDNEEVRRQKAQTRHDMVGQLEIAAARGVQNPQGANQPPATGAAEIQPGHVEDGYQFVGGDPADPNSWRPVR